MAPCRQSAAAPSSVAVQSDGKIIIGGKFTAYDGVARGYVARLWN